MALRLAMTALVSALARRAVKDAMKRRKFEGLENADVRSYTVAQLLASGSRFVEDYGESDAVEHYLELHPEADEAAVRAELQAEIARRNPR